jgi:thiol-disulfide isomerase/thioredoxin
MRAFLTSISCSVLAILFAGCQSQTYKIIGTAEGLADGDTLLLTDNMTDGTPTDTIILKGNTFSFTGEVDKDKEAMLCMVYSAKHNEINAPFIREPGEITINLSATPGAARVSGTPCNNEWQRLNDSVMVIGKEINRIAEHIYGNTISQEEQQRGMEQIEKLNKRFSDVVIDIAEKNIDNEFGYFVLTYYPEDVIDDKNRQRLIEKLAAERRQRPAIQEIEAAIRRAAKTAEGATIPNFSQLTPEDESFSIMTEVSKNKITIIDFWASWCGPCRQEMPFMLSLYEDFKDRGLGIVGVSLDKDKDAWIGAIKTFKLPWPQMSDLKFWDNDVAKAFNVTSIPHTVVVDQKGKILRRGMRGEVLKLYIEEQLGK